MKRERIDELAGLAGVGPPRHSDITVVGDDPIYPSPLPLGAGASTVLSLVAAAIDDLWARRTGRRQPITIDLAHAAVTISSMWLLRIGGRLALEHFADAGAPSPVTGVFRCRDGRWLLIMDSFPHLTEAALRVLGCEASRDAVTRAIAARDSIELEDAFVEASLTGVIVREPAEWIQHPQGRWIHDVPAVQIEKIGEAPPTPLPDGPRPLTGLRVLDSTRILAGPTIARTLAEFGADVLHVGSPNLPVLPPGEVDTGHGKRRAYLDLEQPGGSERMRELVSGADVFSQSYRSGAMARRGFGPEVVAALRPGIIYVSENCYGHGGPWERKRGFDGNAQAASGITLLNERDPERAFDRAGPAMAMNDYCTGYWGAYGVLAALERRAAEGGSWHVKVSLSQTARWFLRMGTPYAVSSGMSARQITELAERYSERVASPYGELQRLRPVIQMPETPGHWELAPAIAGTHAPTWSG